MDIKGALTRKIGPFPAWAWLLGLGVGLYWYRSHKGAAATTASTVTGQNVGTLQPQSPITLQPGESVYDPNTGALTSAPGGSSGDTTGGSGGGTDLGSLTDAISAAIAAAEAGQQNNLTPNGDTGTVPTSPVNTITTPTGKTANPKRTPKLTPKQFLRGKGAKPAPVGGKKPSAPKGYHTVGLGSGRWEFLPGRARSRATAKNNQGGRTTPRTHATQTNKPISRPRTQPHSAKPAPRPRPKPPAPHSAPPPRPRPEPAHPAPKPPPPPPKPKPKPAPKRRK